MKEIDATDVRVGDFIRTSWAGFQKVLGRTFHNGKVTLCTLFGELQYGAGDVVEVAT